MSAAVSSRGAASCLPLPPLRLASSARLPAIRAAISPAVFGTGGALAAAGCAPLTGLPASAFASAFDFGSCLVATGFNAATLPCLATRRGAGFAAGLAVVLRAAGFGAFALAAVLRAVVAGCFLDAAAPRAAGRFAAGLAVLRAAGLAGLRALEAGRARVLEPVLRGSFLAMVIVDPGKSSC